MDEIIARLEKAFPRLKLEQSWDGPFGQLVRDRLSEVSV